MRNYSPTCELVNTYEILEHIMGIKGLHPHSLETVESIYEDIRRHTDGQEGVILDIGCGSGSGSSRLVGKLSEKVSLIGIDINERAIDTARKTYTHQNKLSFYQGSLEDFCQSHSDLNIIGVIAVSVSMFLPDIDVALHL